MTILTWPTLSRSAPPSLEWSLISNTMSFGSALSGSVQTLETPGARWRFSYPMNNLSPDDSALLRCFLVQLRGRSGRFYMHNWAHPAPRGGAGGVPVVAGAGQSGVSLATSGWPASSLVLKAGDFFEVNSELKMAVADVVSNAGGAATVVFEPPLRSSPLNGAAITTTKPKGVFMLDDDTSGWSMAPSMRGPLGSFAISATEAWV